MHAEGPPSQTKPRPKGLLIALSVYGLLYLVFIVVSFIPSDTGSPVSTTVPFDPFDLEQIFVKLLFVLFLVGYVAAWKNEGVAGLIFVLWWAAMWCLEIFVVAPIKPEAAGGGIEMGLPLFILGILFLVFWKKQRMPSSRRF